MPSKFLTLILTLLTAISFSAAVVGQERVTYYYTDSQDTPLATVDGATGVSSPIEYRPYGVQVLGDAQNGPAYTGHVADATSELVYMQARYYDPKIGRFLSTDPATPVAGNLSSISRYVYADSNPIGNIDPDGRESACVSQANHCDGSNRPPSDVGNVVTDIAKGIAKSAINVDAKFHTGEEGKAETPSNSVQAATMAIIGTAVSLVVAEATEGESAASGVGTALDDSTLVCRGGQCNASNFSGGTGVSMQDGKLMNVSVNSAPGASLQQLSTTIPNGQVGVTTYGQIRAAGGDVIPSPTANNPYHCTMCGLTPQKAEELFQPTVKNPNK